MPARREYSHARLVRLAVSILQKPQAASCSPKPGHKAYSEPDTRPHIADMIQLGRDEPITVSTSVFPEFHVAATQCGVAKQD